MWINPIRSVIARLSVEIYITEYVAFALLRCRNADGVVPEVVASSGFDLLSSYSLGPKPSERLVARPPDATSIVLEEVRYL